VARWIVIEWLDAFASWVRDTGVLGLAVFSVAFVALSLAMLPTLQMYIAVGTIYGVLWGAVIISVLSVVAAAATQLLVHTRLRGWVERRLERHTKLRAIDRGIAEHAFWVALLLRLSPAPFGALNYALSLTKLSLWRNLVATAIGMLPTNVLYAYAGALLHGNTGSTWHRIALFVGIAAGLGAVSLIAWASRRALKS
jgi:uncharacterized membrane protein YdjX (TVP38/TMEM64 family)